MPGTAMPQSGMGKEKSSLVMPRDLGEVVSVTVVDSWREARRFEGEAVRVRSRRVKSWT